VRYLTRVVTPEDYDAAARLQPETCPLYYMGDRRSGHQLLADAIADDAITVASFAGHLKVASTAGGGGGDPVIGNSGYGRACGGRGLLEGIAMAVGRLASFIDTAGSACAEYDAWARAVRNVSACM
jgi:hypothetical protein